jgi:hypothetical protein
VQARVGRQALFSARFAAFRRRSIAPFAGGPRHRHFGNISQATIAAWLEKDPTVTAAAIERRLRPLGYCGGHGILREHLYPVRPQLKPSRGFLRIKPAPGERFEVAWGPPLAIHALEPHGEIRADPSLRFHHRLAG